MTTEPSPLTWKRLGPGFHEARRNGIRVFVARRDHRPGVTGWKLSYARSGDTVGTFSTLTAAKAGAQ